VNFCPSNLLSGSTPPPPSLCEQKYCIHVYCTVCMEGGEYGVLGFRQINTCRKVPIWQHGWRHFALPSMSLIFLRCQQSLVAVETHNRLEVQSFLRNHTVSFEFRSFGTTGILSTFQSYDGYFVFIFIGIFPIFSIFFFMLKILIKIFIRNISRIKIHKVYYKVVMDMEGKVKWNQIRRAKTGSALIGVSTLHPRRFANKFC
jgi:hypothetical protein